MHAKTLTPETFLDTGLPLFADMPHKVRDLSPETVRFGRKELELALHEMPGLAALRAEYAGKQPLKGARIMGSLHMTIQTGVLIETLIALGAEVRWVSCNIFSTQDHAAAAVVAGPDGSAADPKGPAVFAWKGETLAEYWWCTEQALAWPDGAGPNVLLDDRPQLRIECAAEWLPQLDLEEAAVDGAGLDVDAHAASPRGIPGLRSSSVAGHAHDGHHHRIPLRGDPPQGPPACYAPRPCAQPARARADQATAHVARSSP